MTSSMKKNKFITLLLPLICGCGVLKFPVLNAPKPPETIYSYEQTFDKNPTAVVVGDKVAVVERQTQTVRVNYDNKVKPLTWWQRFCNWLFSWSLITVCVVLGCLAFGFTAPILWLYNRYLTFRKTSKQIVKSIEESKALEVNRELKVKLSGTLDTDSKKVVDDLRRE